MGFSIGALIGGLAPIVGSLFGPVGTALGGAVSAAFLSPPSSPSQVGPTAQTTQAGALVPLIRGGLGVVGGMATGSVITQLLRQAFEATGIRYTSKQIKEMVRVCGIAQTAATTGLSESAICTIAIKASKRRRRGISASDLRRTRSTIRKVIHIQKDLKQLSTGRRH